MPRVAPFEQDYSGDFLVLVGRSGAGDAAFAPSPAGIGAVFVVGPTPHWSTSLPNFVARRWVDVPKRTWHGVVKDIVDLDKSLSGHFASDRCSRYLSAIDALCDADDGCLVYLGNDVTSGLTSFDYGHLTLPASRDLAQRLLLPNLVDAVDNRGCRGVRSEDTYVSADVL